MSKTIETVSTPPADAQPVTAVTTSPSSVANGSGSLTVANGSGSSGAKTRPVSWYFLQGLKVLASLRLTVVLFALSLLLVFFGTLAQIDAGIWTVVKDYFRGFFVWIPLQLIVQFGQRFFPVFFSKTMTIPGALPFPGGWTIGTLLLVNLLAAHAVRFKLSWKRAGVLILHAGMILMLAGELITGIWAVEGNMVIEEGETSNVVLHNRLIELAVIDSVSSKKEDHVTVVPSTLLRKHEKGEAITAPDLPFDIEVIKWMVNSQIVKASGDEDNPATAGTGKQVVAIEQSEVSGVATKQIVDSPAVYAKLKTKDGKDLGSYLFSLKLSQPQTVVVDGKPYEVSLRFKLTYKPYSIQLEKFRFDRYVGTSTPKNFASRVRLVDTEHGEDREVTISMNHPLRHRGDAIFQADWNHTTEKGTVLQVVRNPAWQLPYWSCGIVAFGMILHFGTNLTTFLRRRAGQ